MLLSVANIITMPVRYTVPSQSHMGKPVLKDKAKQPSSGIYPPFND